MKRIKLNKKRQLQLRFNYLFNKKSNYLKNLPKLKYDGLKEIENEKVEILIDKFLGINKFERDYSFFNPPLISMSTSPKEDPQKRKLKLFPDLKILITSPLEKEEPERYKQKEYLEDSFSNIYKNDGRNYKEKINKLYRSYKPINKNLITKENENYVSRNEKKDSSSFLLSIGKQIINESSNKDDIDISVKTKLFNQAAMKNY